MGVPQGSILSVTLFSSKINNLVKILNKDVEGALYVDDFLMSYRAKNTKTQNHANVNFKDVFIKLKSGVVKLYTNFLLLKLSAFWP